MDNVQLARIVGAWALIIAFIIKGIIIADTTYWVRYGRAAATWITIYVYFLIVLRIFSIYEWATRDQLTIISGWAAIIPLFGILLHIAIRGREDRS